MKGKHLILDLYGCPKNLLNDYHYLYNTLKTAIKITDTKILNSFGHQFNPHGVTLLFLLCESHCSIHTFPETNYAAVDLYTCKDNDKIKEASDFIKFQLQASDTKESNIVRNSVYF